MYGAYLRQRLPARADHRVGGGGADVGGEAVVADGAQRVGRRGFAVAAIDADFQARSADKELFRGLAKCLGVAVGVVQRDLGALAELRKTVGVE